MARSWQLAGALLVAVTSARCSLFVDSAELSGGDLDPARADGSSDANAANDANVVVDGATTTLDATGTTDTGADAPLVRDATVIPDTAKVWQGNGHAYLVVVHPGSITFEAAKQEAIALGGHLATIASPEENAYVSALANNTESAWTGGGGPYLGGYQPFGSQEPAGGWTWVTGEPFSFTAWSPGEPSGGFEEDHVQLYARFSSDWNDVGSSPNSFVVEFE